MIAGCENAGTHPRAGQSHMNIIEDAEFTSAVQQFDDYRREISMVVGKELRKLDEFRRTLQSQLEAPQPGQGDAALLEHAIAAVDEAKKRLDELIAFATQDDPAIAFNETIKMAGFAFRASVAARTALVRHTPTLAGFPHTLDPGQNHRLSPSDHIIDYARNAYFQFQASRSGSPRVLIDHPALKKVADSIARTVCEHPRGESAVLFSSAMGAIGSLLDYVVMVSRECNGSNRVARRCWFEIRQYVEERYPAEFALLDECDTTAVLEAIANPQVCGIVLEPMANYPEMPVIDLERIAEKLKKTHFAKPKIVVFDIVHTPDLDIHQRYFADSVPRNLCVALVISGVKYLQAGWDISKSGLALLRYNREDFCFDGQTIYEKLIDIRSVSGRAPSIEEAYLADIETAESFRSRLRRYDDNSRYVAMKLDAWLRKRRLGHVSSPWLPGHPGHELAMRAYGTGGRMFFLFLDPERINEDSLGTLFRNLASAAENEGISLMAAPSFGLAPPHVHIVIRPELPTTLRLSTGSTDRRSAERLLQFLCRYLEEHAS